MGSMIGRFIMWFEYDYWCVGCWPLGYRRAFVLTLPVSVPAWIAVGAAIFICLALCAILFGAGYLLYIITVGLSTSIYNAVADLWRAPPSKEANPHG